MRMENGDAKWPHLCPPVRQSVREKARILPKKPYSDSEIRTRHLRLITRRRHQNKWASAKPLLLSTFSTLHNDNVPRRAPTIFDSEVLEYCRLYYR